MGQVWAGYLLAFAGSYESIEGVALGKERIFSGVPLGISQFLRIPGIGIKTANKILTFFKNKLNV